LHNRAGEAIDLSRSSKVRKILLFFLHRICFSGKSSVFSATVKVNSVTEKGYVNIVLEKVSL